MGRFLEGYRKGYREGFTDGREASPLTNAKIRLYNADGDPLTPTVPFRLEGGSNAAPFDLFVEAGGIATFGIVVMPDGSREVLTLRTDRRVGRGDSLTFAFRSIQFNVY